MEEINQLKSKIKEYYSLKESIEKKVKELEQNLAKDQVALENESKERFEQTKTEYEEKFEQLKNDYEEKKANLKTEYDNKVKELNSKYKKSIDENLSKFKEEEKSLVKLSLEAYKKALFTEFDRKRSSERYDPKESKPLNLLKIILENNDFLPKENLEKIESLFSSKISIDELMYEET
ncbi:MAG: hypothetical protein ACTSRG_21295 [Candidatus Helarchaeota archaeon]